MAYKRGHQLDPGQKFPGRQARGLDPGQIADLNRAARESAALEREIRLRGGGASPTGRRGNNLPEVLDPRLALNNPFVDIPDPNEPKTGFGTYWDPSVGANVITRPEAPVGPGDWGITNPYDRNPGLAGMTQAELDAEAFQQAIRDAAAAAASPGSASHANAPGLNEPSTPGGFSRADNLRILDSMLAPGNSGTITTKNNDGSSTTIKIDPGQQGDGFAGLHGFSGLNVPTSIDDLNLGPYNPDPQFRGQYAPGFSPASATSPAPTQQDDVAAYLAMLEGLGSDDARIDFALDPMGDGSAPGFLSEEAAAELRLGGGGLGDPNSDKYVWKDGKIDLIGAPVATGEDPPGPTPAEQCAAAGGTWNGESCVMPNGETVTAEEQCVNAGGTWNGESCVMPGGEGEEFTFTETQVNTVTNKVQERANIINSMVQAGLVDIGTARTMYDEAVATIFSNFIGEQGRVLRAFKDDLAAAGVQRESDRNAMLASLRQAGIDPGLISAQLAEIDAIYGEGSQAQRDYLDNITRIGSMANIEHGLMGDYIFGGYEQQLRGEGRRMAADAALAGVDKTEALELAAQQAAQLAGIYGGSPDSILAGLLSGVDVAGTLEQRRAVEDAQQFATDERLAGQDFTRGQNLFNTLAGRMTTPYQQAQLDLAEKQYDLNLFETLDEMLQPAAPTALDVDRAHAANYKSALQKAENFRAYGGSEPTIEERIRGIRPDTLADMLTSDEHLALREFGTSAEELVAEEDNLASLSTVVGIPADVIRGAMESGTASQLLAGPMRDLTARLVDYQAPDGTVLRDIPLTQMVALMEADLTRSDVVATADEPLQFYGFNVGTQQTGVDASSLQAALETLMQGGINIEDPLAAFLAAQTLTP